MVISRRIEGEEEVETAADHQCDVHMGELCGPTCGDECQSDWHQVTAVTRRDGKWMCDECQVKNTRLAMLKGHGGILSAILVVFLAMTSACAGGRSFAGAMMGGAGQGMVQSNQQWAQQQPQTVRCQTHNYGYGNVETVCR